MIVERHALRAAMVHVYRLLQRQTSCSLSGDALDRLWDRAGIRRADLNVAIREMQHRHLIVPLQSGAVWALDRTPRGLREYQRLRGNLSTRARDWWTLMQIKWRHLLHSRKEPPYSDRRHSGAA